MEEAGSFSLPASEIGLGGLLFIAMFRTLAIRLSFFDGENALV